jgi:hypothetical protein
VIPNRFYPQFTSLKKKKKRTKKRRRKGGGGRKERKNRKKFTPLTGVLLLRHLVYFYSALDR